MQFSQQLYCKKKLKLLVTEREISLCLGLWPQCTVILPLCRSLYTHIFRELCGTNLMVHGWTALQLWQVDRVNPFYSSSVQKYLLNSTLFKRMNYLSLFSLLTWEFPFSSQHTSYRLCVCTHSTIVPFMSHIYEIKLHFSNKIFVDWEIQLLAGALSLHLHQKKTPVPKTCWILFIESPTLAG